MGFCVFANNDVDLKLQNGPNYLKHTFRETLVFFWTVLQVERKFYSSGCKQIDARSGPLVIRRIKLVKTFAPNDERSGCLFAVIGETCDSEVYTFEGVFYLS